MGLLYKNPAEIITTVEIKQINGKIELDFSADIGKHGTDEPISGFRLTPLRLLEILSRATDYTEEEYL